MNGIFRTFAAISLLLFTALSSIAYDFKVDGIYYMVTNPNDKTVAVTYKEYTPAQSGGTVVYVNDYAGNVEIPEKVTYFGTTYAVTGITDRAFYGCPELTSVKMANSITSMGEQAFKECTKLSEIMISEAITEISREMFYNCKSLQSVVIPNSVVNVAPLAFAQCTKLTTITIGNSVKNMGEESFMRCENLTDVHITDLVAWNNIEHGGNLSSPLCYAKHLYLDGEEVTKINLPNTITNIGDFAFANLCNLTEITIPNSVKSIGASAFIRCTGLKELKIPASVTNISSGAFSGCSGLSEFCIPESVTSLGSSVFAGCSGLKEVKLPNAITSIKDYTFDGCPGLAKLTIPASVTSLGSYVFRGCTALTELKVPNSVTNIDAYAFYESSIKDLYCNAVRPPYTSDTRFYRAPFSASTLYVPSGSADIYKTISPWSTFGAIKEMEFSEQTQKSIIVDGIIYVLNLEKQTASVGAYNSASGDVEIKSSVSFGGSDFSVTKIDPYAFSNNPELTSIIIPNSVAGIGDHAFNQCVGLTSVKIPNSVTIIDEFAFNRCTGLTTVTMGNGVKNIGKDAFYYCNDLHEVHIFDLASWCNIMFSEIDSNPLYYAGRLYLDTIINDRTESEEIKNFEIPNSVTAINDNAFIGYKGLTSVSVPNSVKSIGGRAFYGCNGLTEITIGESVTQIGMKAFEDCSNLSSVTIDPSLTTIAGGAFRELDNLNEIHIKDLEAWCKIEFAGSESNPLKYAEHLYIDKEVNGKMVSTEIKDLVIPNSITTIGYSFIGYKGLTSVTIPNSVTNIGNQAFMNCSNLIKVSIGDSVSDIGNEAFSGCRSLVDLTMGNSVKNIGEYAFKGCGNMRIITIGKALRTVGKRAFDGCSNLKEVHISDLAAWCGIEFETTDSNPLRYAGHLYLDEIVNGKLESNEIKDLVIPDAVMCVNARTFNSCADFKSVAFHEHVEHIGTSAFYACMGLMDIKLPDSLITIGEGAFQSCTGVSEVILPNSLKVVNRTSFSNCSGLKSVSISNSVTEIKSQAFFMCTNLKEIIIPNSVKNIGHYAFYDIDATANVYCKATVPPTPDGSPFYSSKLSSSTLYVPSGCAKTYKNSSVWSDFGTIKELDFSGVEESVAEGSDTTIIVRNGAITIKNAKGTIALYTPAGAVVLQRQATDSESFISDLQPGLYIVVANGKATKVVI